MTGGRRQFIVALLALLAVAAGSWLVSRRATPFASYDRVPAAAAAPAGVSPPSRSPPEPSGRRTNPDTIARTVAAPPVPLAPARPAASAPPVTTDTDSTAAARPHRSDNYGGYGGYGARERRGAPNGK